MTKNEMTKLVKELTQLVSALRNDLREGYIADMANAREILLSKIKCKVVDLGNSWECKQALIHTSGNAFKVTIKYNGKQHTMIYCDNYKNEGNLRDYLYSLWLDAGCYEESRDVYDFARTFYGDAGITPQIRKIYDACKRQHEAIHRLFNDAEIELLSTIE